MIFALFALSFFAAIGAAGITCFASILLGQPILLVGEFAFLALAWIVGYGMEYEHIASEV